ERPRMCRAPRVPRGRGRVLLPLLRVWRDPRPRWAGGGTMQLCLRRRSSSPLRERALNLADAGDVLVRWTGSVRPDSALLLERDDVRGPFVDRSQQPRSGDEGVEERVPGDRVERRGAGALHI